MKHNFVLTCAEKAPSFCQIYKAAVRFKMFVAMTISLFVLLRIIFVARSLQRLLLAVPILLHNNSQCFSSSAEKSLAGRFPVHSLTVLLKE